MTLLMRLKDYRQLRSTVDQIPIYCVFGDTVLRSIAEKRPLSIEALSGIRGFTPEKKDRYGGDILKLVASDGHYSHSEQQQQSSGSAFSWGGGRRRGLRRKLLQQAIPIVATGIRNLNPPSSVKTTRAHHGPPSNGDGIYVLELAHGRVYVGRTTDWRRRLTQHMSGHGSAFTQAFPPTGTILPRLGCVTGSPEAAERDETLRYMYLRGIAAVRGWKYTRVEMPESEQADAEANIRELFDLCRRCGHPGHFVSQCKAHFDRLGRPCGGS